jgi:hypothetical protein
LIEELPPHHFLMRIICLGLLLASLPVSAATLNFQLLTWNDTNATAQLPSAVGRKPSATLPSPGDWLVFTADDAALAAANNPLGALSHNLVDLTGAGGSGFNLAPSLSGSLILDLEPTNGSNWSVAVTALAYSGQANALQSMNQFLVTTGSPAASNGAFNVDGLGNTGIWTTGITNRWTVQYSLDFYFATSADGDPSAADVDATFNDKIQNGYLLPVSALTLNALASLAVDDPAGFYSGDFAQYVLTQIAPRLPANATYVLITQMAKTHPGYAEAGLPITTAGLIGNTTIAYTTNTLSSPPQLLSLRFVEGQPVLRFTGSPGQSFQIQRSDTLADWETITPVTLAYPEAGVVEWTDTNPAIEKQFYRVVALTP